jgi:gas vesicle protein
MDYPNIATRQTRRHASGYFFFPAVSKNFSKMAQMPPPIALLGLWIVGFVVIALFVYVVSKIIYDLKREIKELKQACTQDAEDRKSQIKNGKEDFEMLLKACGEELTKNMEQWRDEDLREKLTLIKSIDDLVAKIEDFSELEKEVPKTRFLQTGRTTELKPQQRRRLDKAEDADKSDLSFVTRYERTSDSKSKRNSATEHILHNYLGMSEY